MAQEKTKYIISINDKNDAEPIHYAFSKIEMSMRVARKSVMISFEKAAAEKPDILAAKIAENKDQRFLDAIKKAILVHIFRFKESLNIERICVSIDGKTKEINRENDPTERRFPYVYSLLDGVKNISLGNSWYGLDEKGKPVPNWEPIENLICSTSKSKSQNDENLSDAYSAMYSYLASKGREFEVDRFSNLWTAMNSYYRMVAKTFESIFIKQNNLKTIPEDMRTLRNETNSIWLLDEKLNKKYIPIDQKSDSYLRVRKDVIKKRIEKNEYEEKYDLKTVKLLEAIPEEKIPDLYEQSKDRLTNKLGTKNGNFIELQRLAEAEGTSLFTYILLSYAKRRRNGLFHGEAHTLLLSAYNSYEVYTLRIVNYFLERFLDEQIPYMFQSDGLDKGKIYTAGVDFWNRVLPYDKYKNRKKGSETPVSQAIDRHREKEKSAR